MSTYAETQSETENDQDLNNFGAVSTPSLRHHAEHVTIYVDYIPTTEIYILPLATVTFYSPYLRALVSYNIVNGMPTAYILLPHIEKDMFNVFVQFIHTRTLPEALGAETTGSGKGPEGAVPLLVKVWWMAHLFQGPTLVLRDLAMKRIHRHLSHMLATMRTIGIPASELSYILSRTTQYYENGQRNQGQEVPFTRMLMGLLSWPDIDAPSEMGGMGAWADVLSGYAAVRDQVRWRIENEEDSVRRSHFGVAERYMAGLGEVGPGWYWDG